MEYISALDSYGYSRKTWSISEFKDESDRSDLLESWRIKLIGLIERLFGETYLDFYDTILNREIFQHSKNVNSEESLSISPLIETSLFQLQEYLGFEFPNPGAVIGYLLQNPSLYDVVLYACILTEEEFGQSAQVMLDLYNDPEVDDQYITIYIRQEHYADDIMDRIDVICNEYEEALRNTSGWLLVTTDFMPLVK